MFGLIYSVASYLGFAGAFVYFALFSDGVIVPKTVDSGLGPPLDSALLIDLGLILLFGLQHSIMARGWFKRLLTRVVPPSLERATFVLGSSVVLVLLMRQWCPIPIVLWKLESPIAVAVLWGVNAIGWLAVLACSFMIDHFDLFGLKQALGAFRRVSLERKGFMTPLLYKYVRHPMMTSLLVALWATPQMTIGHLLLSLGMSAYIFVGVHFEERALVGELGAAYVEYRASTPKLLPVRRAKVIGGEAPSSVAATTSTRTS